MRTGNKKKKHWKLSLITAGILMAVLPLISTSHAAQPCEQWSGKALSIQGNVEVSRAGEALWEPISSQDFFCPGDRVRVGKNSRAAILLPNETLLRLAEGTSLTFIKEEKKENALLALLEGVIHFISRTPRSLNIKTPFVNASIDGTEFVLKVESDQTKIWVFEGQVSARNAQGTLVLTSGEAAVAQKGKAPVRKLVVNPRDEVQWALYYPPVIDYRLENYTTGPNAPMLRKALTLYRKGDLSAAFACLDSVPENSRTAQYHDLLASFFLTVGQINKARSNLDQALLLDPNDGIAYALQSVIAVTQNSTKKALELAQKGVELRPQSPVPQIALSYALQARFDIEKAQQSVERAVDLAPQDALAWARLVELELSLGNIDRATASASKAVELDPDQARTQTVLGFANLTQIEIDKAETSFKQAIDLDPADPLPRLGLGLAKIRQGNLDEGTEQIETAAILDPDNSLIRSYLGKAYYEQKRTKLARTEFAIAKELDPNDPTPWFYDAILKQTENRPGEALQDMQKAIALNDNRAVYRSKLLLDQDLAARSANLARIYEDIDFKRVSLNEALKSLSTDWSNFSAHRFLADTYLGSPRIRIARASELLQSQLLQPLNITPIQPQLGGSDLFAFSSASPLSASLNEYSAMYNSNSINWLLSETAGSNHTKGGNNIVSGIHDKISGSIGRYHFETDGFQENDFLEQEILTGYAQYALSPKLNIQVELRDEATKAGDVPSRINSFHKENLRQRIDQETARIGVHYEPSVGQDLIFSGFYTRFEEHDLDLEPNSIFPEVLIDNYENDTKYDGYQIESQYLFNTTRINWITGIGYIDLSTDKYSVNITSFINHPDVKFLPHIISNENDVHTKQFNGYIYSLAQLGENLISVFGFSFDNFDNGLVDKDQFNPKFGLQWTPFNDITIRTAIIRALKRPLAMNQTIEPTQVAGFNQLFDDNNGAQMWRYGIAVDYKPSQRLYGGIEFSWRNTEQPITRENALVYQDRDEVAHLAYLYWVPHKLLTLSSEYRFDKFNRDDKNIGDPTNPRSLVTHTVQLAANYHHPKGLFIKTGGIYIDQQAEFIDNSSNLDKLHEDFLIFNATIGYRIPKRIGSIELSVHNIFDKKIRYHSTYDVSGPQLSPYKPERQFFLSVNLSF
ncbi:TonB-dependent receptor domain-containing protein [uncultured Desulfobacter sp.]|uniref:TonB-dependent receptor domain-containing protein n=2 Tax=uncultured Desulfobacter sp. TaxID=240139 RepID=UPI002AA825F4|nr:TonB-dependent receptor [uncultured Desulfobacter sp.]